MKPRIDRGRLPKHIPEPTFVADPNHRKKVWTGDLYKLLQQNVGSRCTLTKNDVAGLGKNFGHMIRGLSRDNVRETDFVKHGITVLDHHFDDHQYCGLWCPRKRMTQQQLAASPRFYRCKEKDAKLYAMLSGMLSQFITLEKLLKMWRTGWIPKSTRASTMP
jgi:hypothetical protein